MLPKKVTQRLNEFGYGTDVEILNRIAARIVSLPGVANDPVTKSSIDIILRMELNPNADPIDTPSPSANEDGIPPGTPRNPGSRNRGKDRPRKVTDLPGL